MARVLSLELTPSGMVLEETARVIQKDGVIAMPTESFYAVGASARNEAAVRRVSAMKGRRVGKPILVLIPDQAELAALVAEVTPAAAALIEQFWPGPLTLIFRASRFLPDALTEGAGTVGVRHTAYPMLVPLLRHVGPLTGTSANRAGQPPAKTAGEVQAMLGTDLDLILDGGPTPGGMPSTIIDTVGPVRVLREGPISRHQIESALSHSGLALAS